MNSVGSSSKIKITNEGMPLVRLNEQTQVWCVHKLDLGHIVTCISCSPHKPLKLYVWNISRLSSFYEDKGRWRKVDNEFLSFFYFYKKDM